MPRFVGGGLGADIPFSHYFPPDRTRRFWSGAAKNVSRWGLQGVAVDRALGVASRVVKRIKGVINRKPQSEFKQIMFAPVRRRRRTRRPMGRRGGPSGRRVTKVSDPTSYRQLTSVKRRSGRKVRQRTRAAKLWKTITTPYRLRFGNVQDINAAVGTYWLTQQLYGEWPIGSGVQYQRQPVYLLNLTSVTQASNGALGLENIQSAPKMWELATGYTSVGQHRWFPVPGIDPTVGSGNRFTGKLVAPTESNTNVLGRKGLLDWTRLKMCFWGKTKNPSEVRVRIVRFLDEEFCPEASVTKSGSAFGYTEAFTPKVAEFWNQELKYLLNGHMGGYSRFDRGKYMKVLQEFKININPIDAAAETDNSDPRPHMKHLDIFNRWNRVFDFTNRDSIYPQSLGTIQNINMVEAPGNQFSGYPKHHMQNIYCLIESVQPLGNDGTPSNAQPRPKPNAFGSPAIGGGSDLSVSFDVILEQNFTNIEPYTATLG